MTRSFYGRKMLLADLAIITIWALFSIRYTLCNAWPAMVYILMRMALCFEMRKRSSWVLYSAIVFLWCYGGFVFGDISIYPIRRIFYYIAAWMGFGSDVVNEFAGIMEPEIKVWLYLISALSNMWIIGLPLLVGISQKNIGKIDWRRKWIWIYIAVSICLSLWVESYETLIGTFLSGLLLAILPIIYWFIYNRNGRSVVALLAQDKAVTLYVEFVILLLLCMSIGLKEITFIKTLGLLVIPPLFYIMMCRGFNFTPLTRHAVAMAVCGVLYIFIFTAPFPIKVATVSISVLLSLYVALDVLRKRHSGYFACIMFITPIAVICPILLGINPYVLLDVDSVSKSYFNSYGTDRVYVIEVNDAHGLRDRYGMVLEPKYDRIERLDKSGRYLSVNLNKGSLITGNRFGIYDIILRQFVLDPESVEVSQIKPTGENRFDLISPDSTHFATFLLRGFHPEINDYVGATTIEPYRSPAELRLEADSATLRLAKDLEAAQPENAGSYVLLDEARVNANRRFKRIIDKSENYKNIYNKWSDLMESMSVYLVKVTYGEPYYSMQPLEFNSDIRCWYEAALPELDIDYDILVNEHIYTSVDSTKTTDNEISAFFWQFHPHTPGMYNRMWNEIQPAFSDWIDARSKFAEDLSPHQRLSFEDHTSDLINRLFNEIKSLDQTRNDNLIYDRQHKGEE